MIHDPAGRLLVLISIVAVVVAPTAGAVGASGPGSPVGSVSAEDGDEPFDFGVELEQQETVTQGGDVNVSAFVNNLADQPVSNTTVELLVDSDDDARFESGEVVASQGASFVAGEYREIELRYSDVQLAAGDYSYQARVSKDGRTVRSYTNGTLTVTGGEDDDGEPFDFGVELEQREIVTQGGDVNVSAFVNNLADQPVSNTTVELRVDSDDDARFESGEVVASRGESFAAGEYREIELRYPNVGLSAGNYSYQARVSKDGRTVRSYTNGTLTVSGTGSSPAVGCRDVTTSGYHTLGRDVTNSTERYCINVTADDVILDGQGHTIDGVGATRGSAAEPPVGVYVDADNVTVRNLSVTEWQTGVVYRDAGGQVLDTDVRRADLDGVVVDNATVEFADGRVTAGDDGFQVEDDASLSVAETTVDDGGGATALQRGFRANTGSYLNLRDVTVADAAITGVLVNVDTYANVTDSEVLDSDVGVAVSSSSRADVVGTNVTGSATDGVAAEFDSTVRLDDSRVADSGDAAVRVDNSSATVVDSRIEAFGEAGVLVTRSTDPGRVEVHGSDLVDADDVPGVDNRNSSATPFVNATGNYWGAADGPSSQGFGEERGFAPFEDPVTAALANGSGTGVPMATRTTAVYGVSNVHFDPYLSSPVAGADPGDGTGGTANATYEVVLDGAPDGLREYNVTVDVAGGTVTAVEPALLTASFEVFARTRSRPGRWTSPGASGPSRRSGPSSR
jgi:hypothetical protein